MYVRAYTAVNRLESCLLVPSTGSTSVAAPSVRAVTKMPSAVNGASTSGRTDEVEGGEVAAIAGGVAREEGVLPYGRMRADLGILQRGPARPAATAVRQEALARQERPFPGQGLATEERLGQRILDVGGNLGRGFNGTSTGGNLSSSVKRGPCHGAARSAPWSASEEESP